MSLALPKDVFMELCKKKGLSTEDSLTKWMKHCSEIQSENLRLNRLSEKDGTFGEGLAASQKMP